VVITRQKAFDQLRWSGRQKRGGGQVRGDSVFFPAGEEGRPLGFDQIAGSDPTPEFLAVLNEEHERLLDLLLDDTLRKVAIWRMEGYTNSEMAEELGVSPGTVERKLRLIRSKWERELD
jgi:DNA-directed RNA polymerase specialized sigma24 family protein